MINLSKTTGGGGSGIPVNGVQPINAIDFQTKQPKHIVEFEDGSIWLRSGVLIQDVGDTDYPEVEQIVARTADFTFEGAESFNATLTNPSAVVSDGTNTYLIRETPAEVYTLTAPTFAIDTNVVTTLTGQSGDPEDACWDGTHFWVLDDASDSGLNKYDQNWNHIQRYQYVVGQLIEFDPVNSRFLVANRGGTTITEYDHATLTRGDTFDIFGANYASISVGSMSILNDMLYIRVYNSASVREFYLDLTVSGGSGSVGQVGTGGSNITQTTTQTGQLLILDNGANDSNLYTVNLETYTGKGMISLKYETDSGYPLYMRIK